MFLGGRASYSEGHLERCGWSADRRGEHLCLPKDEPSLMRENCWSRGQKVSELLIWARVECRPSSVPPISMNTVLVFQVTKAISAIAHCCWSAFDQK